MGKRIEIEKKFYCNNHDKLLKKIEKKNLELIGTNREIDEYFTDIQSTFIANRTCLRIRTQNNDYTELTFKGKSKDFSNSYAKIENNIKLNKDEYSNIIDILNALGYFSYSIVDKTRSTYSRKDNDITYNIMVDHIPQIGDFVEFELLCDNNDKDIEILQTKLSNFVDNFSDLNFESANLPYRDFVAHKNYINILPSNKLEAILLDLDGTLINSEKKFYESFRNVLYNKYNIEITIKDYEENELKQNANLINYLKESNKIPKEDLEEEIMKLVYDEYEKEFMELLSETEVHLNFELLKILKSKEIKLALVSTCRKKFINILLEKLNIKNLFDTIISREDVANLKPSPDAYIKALEELNLNSDNCIAIEDSERGIKSSIEANIKTIQVNDYLIHKNKSTNVEVFDKLSRILLVLINYVR